MIRRQFLHLAALTGASTLTSLKAMAAGNASTIVFQVRGFTCITCAVGLDTLLRKEQGIVHSDSLYPEGKVTVQFDPDHQSEASIRDLIAQMGFTVVSAHKEPSKA